MPSELAWAIALISTVLCLYLWFRDVRKVMQTRKSTLDSAADQLAICQARAARTQSDPESTAVLERSKRIYRQAEELYEKTLSAPWNYLPARLMGYQTNKNRGGIPK